MNEEEKRAVDCIKEAVELWDRYSMPINYSDGWYEQLKIVLKLIENQQEQIKELEKERDGIYDDYQDLGKEFYILQTKNEETTKKYLELIKEKCTDKEWQHCRVEKMGCKNCYYEEVKK